MKKVLFGALLLISSTSEATWTRIASIHPIANDRNIFVATYLHDGALDSSLPEASRIKYFLTVVYDLEMASPIVYTRSNPIQASVTQLQLEAKRFAVGYERKKRLRDMAEGYKSQDESEDEEIA